MRRPFRAFVGGLALIVSMSSGLAAPTPQLTCPSQASQAGAQDAKGLSTLCTVLESKGGEVTFLAIGRPTLLEINGKGSAPVGEVMVKGRSVSGIFSFDLASIETGLPLRNRHLREKYLEVDKEGFAEAKLRLDSLMLPSDLDSLKEQSKLPFEGLLSLRGVEKPVRGELRIERLGPLRFRAEAQFPVHLPDFAIPKPSFAGIGVDETVQVQVKVESLTRRDK